MGKGGSGGRSRAGDVPVPAGPLRLGVPGSPSPVSPRFCASFWSCSAVFAPPRHRAGSEQRFLLHNPWGSFPHPASRRLLRQPPIWKGHFQSIRAPPARTRVRNHFSASFIGILHRKHAARFGCSLPCRFSWAVPGWASLAAPQGAARGLWGSFSARPAGKNRRQQSRQEGGRESRAREIPQRSLLAFCFLPFQPQESRDRV